MKKLVNYFLAVLVVALSLSACGGGGGGGGGSSTTVTRTVTSISYSGQYQIYTYSDGTTQSNSPSSSSVAYSSDYATKTTTYTYSDSETNAVAVSSTSSSESYASDHVTRTTTYTYSDSTTYDVVDTVAGTETYSYSGSTQTITTTYGDGHTSTSTNSAISSSESYASDHVTRTTTYTYANSETNDVVDTVAGTDSSSYAGDTGIRTDTTTYGDGYSSSTTESPVSMTNTTNSSTSKTTVWTYSDGSTLTEDVSGSTLTKTVTDADGNSTVSYPSVSSTAYATGSNTLTTTYTFDDSYTNSVPLDFSWSNYTTYTDTEEMTLTGTGGINIIKLGDSHKSYADLDSGVTLSLTYSAGSLETFKVIGYANNPSSNSYHDFNQSGILVTTGSCPNVDCPEFFILNGYSGNSEWETTSFSTFDTNFDYWSTTSALAGTNRLIVSKSGSSYYNYSTFGTWNIQFIRYYTPEDFNASIYGTFYAGTESTDISAADGQTFTGQVVGMAVPLDITESSNGAVVVTSDLSVSVSGTSLSFTASNTTLDGVSDTTWDFTGSATYATYNGVDQFRGTVDFNNLSQPKGQIVGNFFGPNAEELAGLIQSTWGYSIDPSSSSDQYSSYYEAAFGAKR